MIRGCLPAAGIEQTLCSLNLLGQPGLIQVVVIKLKIDPFAVQALFKASAQFCQARAVGADSLDAVTKVSLPRPRSVGISMRSRPVLPSCALSSSVSLRTRDVIAGAGVAGTCLCYRCQSDISSEKFGFNDTKTLAGICSAGQLRRSSGVAKAIDCLLTQDFFGNFAGGDARELLTLEEKYLRYLESGDLVSEKAG